MKLHRVIIAKIVSPPLFLMGHLISLVMHWPGLGRLYVPYNKLMCASIDVEDWAGIRVIWGYPPTSLDDVVKSLTEQQGNRTEP